MRSQPSPGWRDGIDAAPWAPSATRDALRLRGTDAEERGLPDADEEAIIAAMVANPAYVNRPFVETDKGVRFCRPQDVVREIL